MFNPHFNVDFMAHKLIASLAIFCSLTTFIHAAQAAEGVTPIPKVSDGWRVSVSPYAWIPQVNTTTSVGGGGSKNADISMNSVINNLKTGAMIAGEVHNGKWGLIGDLATATLQKSGGFNYKGDPQYRAGDKSTLQATLASLAGTYTVLNNSDIYMDALVGVRWISLTTTFDLMRAGGPVLVSASSATPATYGIVGLNGRYRIMDSSWYIPAYVDVGNAGGSNHSTWQASLGLGVALSKMVDVSLSYRAVGFDIKSGTNDSTLLKGLFHGPQIMATFNF